MLTLKSAFANNMPQSGVMTISHSHAQLELNSAARSGHEPVFHGYLDPVIATDIVYNPELFGKYVRTSLISTIKENEHAMIIYSGTIQCSRTEIVVIPKGPEHSQPYSISLECADGNIVLSGKWIFAMSFGLEIWDLEARTSVHSRSFDGHYIHFDEIFTSPNEIYFRTQCPDNICKHGDLIDHWIIDLTTGKLRYLTAEPSNVSEFENPDWECVYTDDCGWGPTYEEFMRKNNE